MTTLTETEDLAHPDTPDEVFEGKEESLDLKKAINNLKEPFKEIIILHSFSELSFKEIGDIFNQSEGWARTNFYRAKLQLRNFLINMNEEV